MIANTLVFIVSVLLVAVCIAAFVGLSNVLEKNKEALAAVFVVSLALGTLTLFIGASVWYTFKLLQGWLL